MRKQISCVFAAIITIIAASVLVGCASGPAFGQPSDIQKVLNAISDEYPIQIAGKEVKISFEGDYWRGKVDGKDVLAGICKIEETETGLILTINQSWAYVDSGKVDPVKKEPIAKWQKTPGPELVLEYNEGPPASITKK